MRGHFAWEEYKGNRADLGTAYQQLLQYREALENPPLLVVSDFQRFEIHTNVNNTAKRCMPLPPMSWIEKRTSRCCTLFTDPKRL